MTINGATCAIKFALNAPLSSRGRGVNSFSVRFYRTVPPLRVRGREIGRGGGS